MSLFAWILAHKLVTLLFAGTAALSISTILLGVENVLLKAKVKEVQSTIMLPGDNSSKEMLKYRLPNNLKPVLYDLYLFPDLKSGLYEGRVKVHVHISSETKNIQLHSKSLTINSVRFDTNYVSYNLDEKYDLLIITNSDDSEFPIGSAVLEIEFKGDMKKKTIGLYTSSYKNASGENIDIPVVTEETG